MNYTTAEKIAIAAIVIPALVAIGVMVFNHFSPTRQNAKAARAKFRSYIDKIINGISAEHACAMTILSVREQRFDLQAIGEQIDCIRPHINAKGIFDKRWEACKNISFGQYSEVEKNESVKAALLGHLGRLRELAK